MSVCCCSFVRFRGISQSHVHHFTEAHFNVNRCVNKYPIHRKRELNLSVNDVEDVRQRVVVDKIGDWEKILGSFSFFMPIIA